MNPSDRDPSRIAAMFSRIAPRYDRTNHALSLWQDRRWRARLAREANLPSKARVLDLCTGTGDLALALARRHPTVRVTGLDLSEEMLRIACAKAEAAGLGGRVRFQVGDASALPFEANCFEAVSIAFGLRNLPDYRRALREMYRVLIPGGEVFILEFSQPEGVWGRLYRPYLKVLPYLGGWLSGHREPYEYLRDSIRAFPAQKMSALLRAAGFVRVAVRPLSGGIALIHRGRKPQSA